MEVVAVSDPTDSAIPGPGIPGLTEFGGVLVSDDDFRYVQEVEAAIAYVAELLIAARTNGYAVFDVSRAGARALLHSYALGNPAEPNSVRDALERTLRIGNEGGFWITRVDEELRFFVITRRADSPAASGTAR